MLGCFAAVIMRESVTLCRFPDIPKLEHALKNISPAQNMADKSTDLSDEVLTANKEISNVRQRR